MTCATPLLLQVATKVEKGEELLLLGVQRREGTDRSGMTNHAVTKNSVESRS
jgi:hypothetical protein